MARSYQVVYEAAGDGEVQCPEFFENLELCEKFYA
jgi:hypothetical protein